MFACLTEEQLHGDIRSQMNEFVFTHAKQKLFKGILCGGDDCLHPRVTSACRSVEVFVVFVVFVVLHHTVELSAGEEHYFSCHFSFSYISPWLVLLEFLNICVFSVVEDLKSFKCCRC